MMPSERELNDILAQRGATPAYRHGDDPDDAARHMANICRWWIARDLSDGGLRPMELPSPADGAAFLEQCKDLFPQPMMLYISTVTTATADEEIIIDSPRPLPRAPGALRHIMGTKIGRDQTVDIMYAKRRGILIPFNVLLDQHKVDDLTQDPDFHTIPRPKEPLGQAIHQTAEAASARCRHWTVTGAARAIDGMRRESDLWSTRTGIAWRPLLAILASVQTLEDAADVIDICNIQDNY